MAYFKPYAGSDASKAHEKVKSDALSRSKTVEADVKRIKPKLGQYKKETLERLIKETEKAMEGSFFAASDKVQSQVESHKSEASKLKKQLLAAEQKRFDDATVEARKAYQAAVAAINAEYDATIDDVEVDLAEMIHSADHPRNRLEAAYEELLDLYRKELKKASAEREPSPERKI